MEPNNQAQDWVAVLGGEPLAAVLLGVLHEAGVSARHVGECTDLAQCAVPHAPQAVLLALPSQGTPAGSLQPRCVDWDVPVIAVGAADTSTAATDAQEAVSSQAEYGLQQGVHHWILHLNAADWPASLSFAQTVHRREQALRQRIAGLKEQLTEQRLVARAKGLLMAAQGMSEDEAFALLRSGAMHTRLPLADMARTVVDAAVWAQAVNRAGRLRWLSQRCIAAAAQRLARIEVPAARRVAQQAQKQARDILDELGRLPLSPDALQTLARTDAAWLGLRRCLARRLELVSLAEADIAANSALAAAEALTGALQREGNSPMLRVVNLCGRQRMRAQRLVKLGLMARLGVGSADAAEAPSLMAQFDDTLLELEALPLGSDQISAAHRLAAQRWRDMGLALQSDDATGLVRSGEALIDSVDALTDCWQRSLQWLVG